jgi:hypothetical protein
MSLFDKWDSFYVIVGSAAGALIGLQFVVITLVAERAQARSREGGAAFSTPTIVHFSVALALSALLRAPWESLRPACILSALLGILGAVYVVVVARRMRAQRVYTPDLEDWTFHAIVPFAAYTLLAGSALALAVGRDEAAFGIGGASLLLLFDGIHNTWDAATFHVLTSGNVNAPDGNR